MKIDTTAGRLAAVASSREDGRERWTELRVFHLPLLRRPWVAEALGCSVVHGETVRRRRLASASLERALRLFDDSDLGVMVKETAREWADEESEPTCPPQFAPADDREALALLFGVDREALSINAAATALGLGESSLRMALKNETTVRVPLVALLPFIDRGAFQRAQAGDKSRG